MTAYEDANRARYEASGGRLGMRVVLVGGGGGVFWSRGWRGCEYCGGDVKNHPPLTPFYERVPNGHKAGWRCGG